MLDAKRRAQWLWDVLVEVSRPVGMADPRSPNTDEITTLFHRLSCFLGAPHTAGGDEREMLGKALSKHRGVVHFLSLMNAHGLNVPARDMNEIELHG